MEPDNSYSGTTFAVEKEDHTLANSLRFFLNKNPHVEFCGYSMPHPTEEVVNIRVQTTGEITAVDALRGACQECQKVCNHISTQFKDAVKQYKQSHPEDIEMKDA